MRVLVVDSGFPGCYLNIVQVLANAQHDVVCIRTQPGKPVLGIKVLTATPALPEESGSTHPWSTAFNRASYRAEAACTAALTLRDDGWVPDVVFAMPSYGESWLVKSVFPDAPVISFMEWNYSPHDELRYFDPEVTGSSVDDEGRSYVANAVKDVAWLGTTLGTVTTQTALSTFPEHRHSALRVIHDGVRTKFFSRQDREASLQQLRALGHDIPSDAPVLTFVNRGMEQMRGFHSFMRALPKIQALHPTAHVVVVGNEDAHYGPAAPDSKSWKDICLSEVGADLDPGRIHWCGWVAQQHLRAVFSVSDCHLYLTAPIQLSLSVLEAMSCQAPVVTNRLAQTEEFIDDGVEGRYVDFFDYDQIANACVALLNDTEAGRSLGAAARQRVVNTVDLSTVVIPKWSDLINEVTGGKLGELETPPGA